MPRHVVVMEPMALDRTWMVVVVARAVPTRSTEMEIQPAIAGVYSARVTWAVRVVARIEAAIADVVARACIRNAAAIAAVPLSRGRSRSD